MWVLVLMLTWNAPAIAVVDNLDSVEICDRIGKQWTNNFATGTFRPRYVCLEKR